MNGQRSITYANIQINKIGVRQLKTGDIIIIYDRLIDFLSFRGLWSRNGDSTRKCKHLFPVWSLFTNPFSATHRKMEPEYREGGHC